MDSAGEEWAEVLEVLLMRCGRTWDALHIVRCDVFFLLSEWFGVD
jgi:hypothetical protein